MPGVGLAKEVILTVALGSLQRLRDHWQRTNAASVRMCVRVPPCTAGALSRVCCIYPGRLPLKGGQRGGERAYAFSERTMLDTGLRAERPT